jgi:hypothetical protein
MSADGAGAATEPSTACLQGAALPPTRVGRHRLRRLDVETFAGVIRGDWGMALGDREPAARVLGVVFRDDLAWLRSGNGPAKMAVIRHTALDILGQRNLPPVSQSRDKGSLNSPGGS